MDPRDRPEYPFWVHETVRRQHEERANFPTSAPYIPFSERGKVARFFRVIGYTLGTIFWIILGSFGLYLLWLFVS